MIGCVCCRSPRGERGLKYQTCTVRGSAVRQAPRGCVD
nr:MAG TPA: hypothetical protein [Bacteriophage sp.]